MNYLYFVFFIANLSFVHDPILYYVVVAAACLSNLIMLLFKLLNQRKGEKIKSGLSYNDVRGAVDTFKLFRSDDKKEQSL